MFGETRVPREKPPIIGKRNSQIFSHQDFLMCIEDIIVTSLINISNQTRDGNLLCLHYKLLFRFIKHFTEPSFLIIF